MAHWLIIHGNPERSWSAKKLYRGPGPHPLDPEDVAVALESGMDWLEVVEDDEAPAAPEQPTLSGPLTATDIIHGTEGTPTREEYDAEVAAEEAARAAAEAEAGAKHEQAAAAASEWPCPHADCDRHENAYKSEPALQRHIEMKHGNAVPEAAPEAEADADAEEHAAEDEPASEDAPE